MQFEMRRDAISNCSNESTRHTGMDRVSGRTRRDVAILANYILLFVFASIFLSCAIFFFDVYVCVSSTPEYNSECIIST